MNEKERQIAEKLVEVEKSVKRRDEYLPTGGCKKAQDLISDLDGYPHAFVLGCVLDRRVKAEKAWIAPYKLKQRIGNFEFSTLKNLSKKDWEEHFKTPKPLHLLTGIMPDLLYKAVKRISEQYNDDASNIWKGNPVPSSGEIIYRFVQFDGIGQKISTMAVKILKNYFKIKMSGCDIIDVSNDVHIKRVFYRLGLIPEQSGELAINTARRLKPEFPGILDDPAWHIGREWCKAQNPDCGNCPMNKLCPTAKGQV